MTLARRHFQDLAMKLKRARESFRDSAGSISYKEGGLRAIDIMELNLIHFCEAESPTFDRAKFEEAARL